MPEFSNKTSTPKIDNPEKCAGTAKYVDDIVMDGMLFAKALRSSFAHAKILSISLPEIPRGYYYIDRRDIVKENVVNMIFSDWPVFANEEVNYLGEPIGLVIGEDKAIIDKILSEIKVEYQELTPIFEYVNNYVHKEFKKGDFAKARQNASHIFEETFETGYQEQAYLETQGMLAYPEDDGKITLVGSMQCPYYIKNAVMRTLGYDEQHVRVIQPSVGGAFGGKEDFPSTEACQLATAVFKIKRPIKMVLPRDEDINVTTKRHPSTSMMTACVDAHNHITGLQLHVSLDGGAYKGLSGVVLARAMIACTNAYTIDNLDVKGDVYMTNTVPTGAFRGFGSPQTIFAMEMFIHHIARDLGIDPLKMRLSHLAKEGDVTSTSGLFHDPIILPKLIEKAMEMSDYKRKIEEYSKPSSHRGIGMSFFLHGCGFTGSGESDHIKAKVKLTKDEKDVVTVYAAAVDMGQGNRTTLKRIVARELDVPNEMVIFNSPDTDVSPDSGPTAASRTIMIVGGLMEKAAKHLKEIWKKGEKAEIIEHYVGPSYIHFDDNTMQGDAYPSYSWGVNIVEVEVSPITDEVTIKGVWSTYDIGTCIDERIAFGQADGGIAQGLGYGYLENMYHKNGKIMQRNLTDYIIPTTEDIPDLKTVFIDNPFKYGPFGAKGLGELSLVGGGPAVALAIENAVKHKINRIPATPEYIMEQLKK